MFELQDMRNVYQNCILAFALCFRAVPRRSVFRKTRAQNGRRIASITELDIARIKSMLKYDPERNMLMSSAERMTITMPSDMAETLRQTVAGGEYASTSEVVREALRDWTRSRDAERRDLEALRDAIKAGLDSGPGIPADQVFAELRARYADKS